MAFQVKNTAKGTATGPVTSIASAAINQSAGDLIVICVRGHTGLGAITITDTAGNDANYTALTQRDSGIVSQQFWYVKNCLGNAANVVTASFASTFFVGIYVWDVSDADLTAPFDAEAWGDAAAANAVTLNQVSLTTTNANDIILMMCGQPVAGGSTYTAGTNFHLDDGNIGGFAGAQSEVVSATQSGLTTGMGSSSTSNFIINAAAFKSGSVTVATPTFSPVAGAYGPAQTVTISCTDNALPGFEMRYTTDGTAPVPGSHGTIIASGGTITVSVTTTVKVVAGATGDVNSAEADATYTINGAVATPVISYVPASPTTSTVTLTDANSGLSGFAMTYTTDGTTPVPGSHGTAYTVAFTANNGLTIKVVASATNYSNSAEADMVLTVGSFGLNMLQIQQLSRLNY